MRIQNCLKKVSQKNAQKQTIRCLVYFHLIILSILAAVITGCYDLCSINRSRFQLQNNQSMKIVALLLLATACLAQAPCCQNNILSIVGAGSVSSTPDIAQFTVSATAFGKTSAIALSNVNGIISQVSSVLAAKGLPKANYTTSGINLSPQYNYTDKGIAVLIGQQAWQSLSVTVGNLVQNKPLLGLIITALSNINNITISGLTFTTSNTALVNRLARKAAVADALAKAKQYAALGGKALGSVQQIIDQNTQSYVPFYSDLGLYSLGVQNLQIPVGQVSASATVQINWNLSY